MDVDFELKLNYIVNFGVRSLMQLRRSHLRPIVYCQATVVGKCVKIKLIRIWFVNLIRWIFSQRGKVFIPFYTFYTHQRETIFKQRQKRKGLNLAN